LTGSNPQSEVVVERCVFANNGHGDGLSHNMYIGKVRKFTLRFSYSHHAVVGHIVKSRANVNHILYNRLVDEEDGASSMILDLAEGGDALVIGNVLQQSAVTENSTIVSYGAEKPADRRPGQAYIVNNTFVNDRHAGVFIGDAAGASLKVYNNIFCGPGIIVKGRAVVAGNLIAREFGIADRIKNFFTNGSQFLRGLDDGGKNSATSDALFVDRDGFDYRLLPASQAIDSGIVPGSPPGISLIPDSQYVHVAGGEPRPSDGAIDIGAFENSEPRGE
jgi:hypothetical protein